LLDQNIQVNFFLKEAAPKAFLDMICADILIASHSSFSWLALLLRSKKTYIRRGFRHFITLDTEVIDEVLYDDCGLMGKLIVFIKLKIAYFAFYPKYFFKLLTNGVFFDKS
jgi:hypothetical protein